MTNVTWMAMIVASVTGAASAAWFDAPADPQKLQAFQVEGLKSLACGTVYPAAGLEQGGMPLGGVGTGYLCVDPDGRFGKCSIFNRLPAPMTLGQAFLSLELNPDRNPTRRAGQRRRRAGSYWLRRRVARATRRRLTTSAIFPWRTCGSRRTCPCVRNSAPTVRSCPATPQGAMCRRPYSWSACSIRPTNRSGGSVVFAPGGFPAGTAAQFAPAEGWAGVEVTHQPLDRLPGGTACDVGIAVEQGSAETDEAGVCVKAPFDLPPGQATVARFVLAWHQPYLREGSGRVEKHKYAERFADARPSLADAAARAHEWLRRILAWQDVLYGSDLPDWLKEELVNVPYTLTKNSVWLARTRPDDWWGDEGLFLVNESFATCSLSETMPCRFFGHWPALFFFPELELTTLKAIRYFQLRGGEPPFCLGLGFAIRDPRYHCQHTCGAGEYAQMIYRYYLRTGDERFLKDFWESARDSLNFMLWLDRDGDGLVEDHSHAVEGEPFPANNPLDQWPWYGAEQLHGRQGPGVARLRDQDGRADGRRGAGSQVARGSEKGPGRPTRRSSGPATSTAPTTTPRRGRRNDSCFCGPAQQRLVYSGAWAWRTRCPASGSNGAGHHRPAQHPRLAVRHGRRRVCRRQSRASRAARRRPHLVARHLHPVQRHRGDGLLLPGPPGEGEQAARPMLDTIFRGPHAMPWSQPCGLSSVTGGTCHGHDYYDHMVVWSYPLALAGQDIRAACAQGGLIARVLEASKP